MQEANVSIESKPQQTERSRPIYYILFALLLTAFVIYTRMRSHADFLYSWDSVSFALSIERFDMRLHQPHPPGYILYSYTIRLINLVIGDPNLSMIYLNIGATLGACWFLAKLVYLFTKNGTAAAGAAALYATNPVAWFYGSVAEIYAVEGFFVALIAYFVLASHGADRSGAFITPASGGLLSSSSAREPLALQTAKTISSLPQWRAILLICASIAMAIAGGFRPTTEVFLLPLYATGFVRKSLSTILVALSVLVLGNLLWFWPLASSVGGVSEYIEAVRNQSQRATEVEAPAEGMTWEKVAIRTVQTITLPILIALLLRLKQIRLSLKESSLLLAIVPPLVLFVIIHFPKDGYLLLVIPLLIAMFVLLLHKAIASSRTIAAVIFLGCVISIIGFVRPIPAASIAEEFTRPNQQLIENRMRRLKRFFEIVDGLGGGQHKTFVLENRHYFPSWRMLLYYYPDDTIYLIWPNKRRAYVAQHREYRTIVPPLPLSPRSGLVVVGKTAPTFPAQTFQVDAFRYYFCEAAALPPGFQVYSMGFVISSDE